MQAVYWLRAPWAPGLGRGAMAQSLGSGTRCPLAGDTGLGGPDPGARGPGPGARARGPGPGARGPGPRGSFSIGPVRASLHEPCRARQAIMARRSYPEDHDQWHDDTTRLLMASCTQVAAISFKITILATT